MSTSGLDRVKIDRLAGAEDWAPWKVLMRQILRRHKLDKYVTGEKPRPVLDEGTKGEAKAAKEKEIERQRRVQQRQRQQQASSRRAESRVPEYSADNEAEKEEDDDDDDDEEWEEEDTVAYAK